MKRRADKPDVLLCRIRLPCRSTPGSIFGRVFAPRLLFEDTTLWDTAIKLKRSVESPVPENRLYSEALGVVLVHELVRLNRGTTRAEPRARAASQRGTGAS